MLISDLAPFGSFRVAVGPVIQHSTVPNTYAHWRPRQTPQAFAGSSNRAMGRRNRSASPPESSRNQTRGEQSKSHPRFESTHLRSSLTVVGGNNFYAASDLPRIGVAS
jgi:hypothetical protein